jgi:outer membrane protein OmpA-like peptidoglycan-associated protein
MKFSGKKLLGAIALAGMCMIQPSISSASNYDAVEDNWGGYVTSSFGECVRTNWDVGTNDCAPKVTVSRAAPSMAKKALQQYNRSFLVFFDFDKFNLTPSAQEIISDVYTQTKNKRSPRFSVTGHADRSGSDAYNMGLSKRRAEAVKAKLTQLGISNATVTTNWKGESEPLIPTADGIKEPQNRRAEIRILYVE